MKCRGWLEEKSFYSIKLLFLKKYNNKSGYSGAHKRSLVRERREKKKNITGFCSLFIFRELA
jgi:hypothetical protein